MKFNELPTDVQVRLAQERTELHKTWYKNTPRMIKLANADGTRFFYAERISGFDGYRSTGDYWKLHYGVIQFSKERTNNPFEYEFEWKWKMGKCYAKTANGTVIPKTVDKKKDVLTIVKAIGIFDI